MATVKQEAFPPWFVMRPYHAMVTRQKKKEFTLNVVKYFGEQYAHWNFSPHLYQLFKAPKARERLLQWFHAIKIKDEDEVTETQEFVGTFM